MTTRKITVEALAALAYADRPPLGKRPVPWPPSVRRDWTAWASRIFAALPAKPADEAWANAMQQGIEFHSDTLRALLEHEQSCPLCKRPLTVDAQHIYDIDHMSEEDD